MNTLTITAKGQVTLKQSLLQHLGISPGQKISVDILPGGRAIIQAVSKGRHISDVFGILKSKNKRKIILTIEEINEISKKAWAGEE